MFGVPKLYLYGAAALAVMVMSFAIRSAGYNDGKAHERKVWTAKVAQMQADQLAKDQAAMAKLSQLTADQRAVTAQAEANAQAGQVRIVTRTRTLIEKVPQYVPTRVPDGVIAADDRVPVGTVLLLDAAARGDDSDPVSVVTGKSLETASPLRFAQLVRGYIANLGIGHENAKQLEGVISWSEEQHKVSP